jgi:hypothetical protein
MKPHEQKKQGQNKSKKGEKQRAIKNQMKKRRKDNKTLSKKVKRGGKKT